MFWKIPHGKTLRVRFPTHHHHPIMLVIMVHIYYDIPHNGSRKIPILLYVPFMYPICGLFSITHQHPTAAAQTNIQGEASKPLPLLM